MNAASALVVVKVSETKTASKFAFISILLKTVAARFVQALTMVYAKLRLNKSES